MAPALPSRMTREAIVLAAGNGDRFRQRAARSKLLAPVGGVPLRDVMSLGPAVSGWAWLVGAAGLLALVRFVRSADDKISARSSLMPSAVPMTA